MIPYSRPNSLISIPYPKLDSLPESHTLHSGAYPYTGSLYIGVPPGCVHVILGSRQVIYNMNPQQHASKGEGQISASNILDLDREATSV